jgi:hypothetical protein
MSPGADSVLRTLAAGGNRAQVLANVVCALVTEGAKLGELEACECGVVDADKKPCGARQLPREWLDRLGRAVELGVFEKPTEKTLRKVVDRILLPPLPAHIES